MEKKKVPNKKLMLQVVGALVSLISVYFIYHKIYYISTNNAYVQAHVVMISARVPGRVAKVLVDENQTVQAGQILAELETQDYETALDQAEADLSSTQARAKEAQANYKRARDLFEKRAITHQAYDDALAAHLELENRTKSNLAKANQVKLNLSYTQIRAPEAGQISKKSIEHGMFVMTGQPVFGFVSASERWVTANLKETDLNRLKIGNKVKIWVDATGSQYFDGEVESVSASTGATFALIPPDNATGNFTKVIQRVPVRIKFLNLNKEDIYHLKAGLSATVDIEAR